MNTPTRPATPADDMPIDTISLKAPRVPTFFVERELPTDVDNAIPECEDCGHVHDFDDGCPEVELDGADYTYVPGWGFFPW